MKTFFEYFYYKFSKLDNFNHQYAIHVLTTTQYTLFLNMILLFIVEPLGLVGKPSNPVIVTFLLLYFALDYYNSKLYKGRFEEFKEKWGIEDKKNRKVGNRKIILFIIFSWGFIFINGWIYNRYQ
ncbi:hypothetical protein [Flavobacterium limnosediminis]|uniref:hypothetical protein n=1 Tax=Flavobacterium limnosediminis TaxID=1401027 RepID=UPI000552F3D6|nr:hypothetical protein [Flavobacterium limnosediminis]